MESVIFFLIFHELKRTLPAPCIIDSVHTVATATKTQQKEDYLPTTGVTATVPQLFTLEFTHQFFAAGGLFFPSSTTALLHPEL